MTVTLLVRPVTGFTCCVVLHPGSGGTASIRTNANMTGLSFMGPFRCLFDCICHRLSPRRGRWQRVFPAGMDEVVRLQRLAHPLLPERFLDPAVITELAGILKVLRRARAGEDDDWLS